MSIDLNAAALSASPTGVTLFGEKGGAPARLSAEALMAEAAAISRGTVNDYDKAVVGVTNLFDAASATLGAYIAGDGATLVSDAGYNVTPFMRVVPGETITLNYDANANGVHFYDSARQHIVFVSASPSAGVPVQVPVNAEIAYTRMSLIAAVPLGALMVVRGSTLPQAYIPFGLAGVNARVSAARKRIDQRIQDVGIVNLFDPEAVILGSYLSSGTVVTGAQWAITGFIPIGPGDQFISNIASLDPPFGAQFYDDNLTYLPGVGTGAKITAGTPMTVPSDARISYMRFTYTIAEVDRFTAMVVRGAVLPAGFVPFGLTGVIKSLGRYWGKRFGVIGDSISAVPLWQPTLASFLRATVTNTNAVGGSMYNTALDGLTSASVANLDWMILQRGTNDFGAARPLGTYADTKTTDTFAGNFRNVIETLIGWKPTLKIAVFTPLQRSDMASRGGSASNGQIYNSAGTTMQAYVDMLIRIAGDYACPVLDLHRRSGMSYLNAASYTPDGLHPHEAGAPIVIAEPAKGFFMGAG